MSVVTDAGDLWRVSEALVLRLRATAVDLDGASLEQAEVVVVGRTPGLMVLWSQQTADQGHRRFRLLTTTAALEQGSGAGLAAVPHMSARLLLAICEPHGTVAQEGTRTWFTDPPP